MKVLITRELPEEGIAELFDKFEVDVVGRWGEGYYYSYPGSSDYQ